jgi:ribose transport system ATP-binding protein
MAEVDVNQSLIRLSHVTKRFGGVVALNDVSFAIERGEIHAVVGENGAGKSTLMKILAGVHRADSGQILLRGVPVEFASPAEAQRLGISIVHQELRLFPNLTVAGNMFVGRDKYGAGGLLQERAMVDDARRALDIMGVPIDPHANVGRLPIGEKQIVEIARTLNEHSEIIIMDEPNSALNTAESERLFEILRRLSRQGITIIYVSHRLEEVFAIADRISVLRDGQFQGTLQTRETSITDVIAAMIGRRLDETFPPPRRLQTDAAVVLDVQDLRKNPSLGPLSFRARAGEIVGFAGLEGAGIEDLFRILFGLDKPTSGTLVYRGVPRRGSSPVKAAREGWGFIPSNRREEGLIMDASIRENTSVVVLEQLLNRMGLIDRSKERRHASEYVQKLHIATDSIDKTVVNLSGGNQQKVVVAKWLAAGPSILVLNDPTRGVDVGAKSEIYALCDQLARQGLALLFTSSEIEETIGLCDRVMVVVKGSIVREFAHGEASKQDVMQWVAGGIPEEVTA